VDAGEPVSIAITIIAIDLAPCPRYSFLTELNQ
jgi:hypothetical protein